MRYDNNFGLGKRARSHTWRWLVAGAIVVVVLAGLGVYLTHRGQPPTVAKTVQHNVTVAGTRLECPRDLAWSPNDQELAIIGYVGDCPMLQGPLGLQGIQTQDDMTGQVLVYDATRGEQVATLHPDAPIDAAVHLPAAYTNWVATLPSSQGPTRPFGINYTHILWSRSGSRLALTFDFYLPTGAPVRQPDGSSVIPGQIVAGVLDIGVDGSQPQVLLQTMGQAQPPYVVWNVCTGKAMTPTTAKLTPALSYTWTPQDALEPVQPLSASAPAAPTSAAAQTIGNPDGGANFSIWQPGIAANAIPSAIPPNGPGQPLGNVFAWHTDIAAWSPDGCALAEGIHIKGLFVGDQLPTLPTAKLLATYGWAAAPELAMRDAALAQAYNIANRSAFQSNFLYAYAPVGASGWGNLGNPIQQSGVLVAWRPDGHVLAVDAATTPQEVLLLDTANGHQVGVLHPSTQSAYPNAAVEQGEIDVLRWSPDGAHLALLDPSLGTLTLWGPSQLPR